MKGKVGQKIRTESYQKIVHFFNWPFPVSFSFRHFFKQLFANGSVKVANDMDSNLSPLESEAIALSTVSQPLPQTRFLIKLNIEG